MTVVIVVIVVGFGIDDRPSGFRIDTFRPGDLRKRLCGDERARDAVEHVVEAVLVGLHDDFARPAVDREIGEHQSLNAVEVPGIAGSVLVIPLQLTGIGFDREDRADIKVVLALRFAQLFRPRAAVAGADVNQVGIRIVCDAVPDRAAAAQLPPVAGPRFGSFLQSRILKWLRGIAGNRIEPPGQCCRYSRRRRRRIRGRDTPRRSRRR